MKILAMMSLLIVLLTSCAALKGNKTIVVPLTKIDLPPKPPGIEIDKKKIETIPAKHRRRKTWDYRSTVMDTATFKVLIDRLARFNKWAETVDAKGKAHDAKVDRQLERIRKQYE